MLSALEQRRYLRHILLKEVGAQGQQKLMAARALVVGAGGLGCAILPYLVAAGVGVIGIADDDRIDLSNLQRQTLFRTADVGAPKAARAAAALRALNPDTDIVEHDLRVDARNAGALVGAYDVVVEGVDNFEARFALNDAAIAARRPLISAAIGRFEGQLSTFKPWAGEKLPCYRCLAPEAPPRDVAVNCLEEGVLGPVAGIIGSLAALETLKEILGLGDGLAGALLIFDGLAMTSRRVALPADPNCVACGAIRRL